MLPNTSLDYNDVTPAGFRDRVERALKQPGDAVPEASDFELNPDFGAGRLLTDMAAAARPAAVLIPAIARPAVTLLLTQRTQHLSAHAGQIAFPGGKAEPFDADPLATALREAREEIGLEAALATPLGALDRYLTGTGFHITPVIALVDPSFAPVLDTNEVADTFEVPLAFVMDERNYQRHSRTIGGAERHFYAIPFGERFIWGATAGILRNMQRRLFAS